MSYFWLNYTLDRHAADDRDVASDRHAADDRDVASDSSGRLPTLSSSSLRRTKQQARSRYLELARGRKVRAPTTLLRSRLRLRQRDSVFVQSDGTFAPLDQGATGSVHVEIDGRRVSNESVIDWRGSTTPVRHSFNAIGATSLSKGVHDVKLVARPIAGAFTVSRSSNLSILVHPAMRVSVGRLGRKAGPFNFVTSDRGGDGHRLPHSTLVSVVADTRSPTVVLAAASARQAGGSGDAMLGIYLDRRHPGNSSSLWTVNDLNFRGEVQAPLYTQALLRDGARSSLVSLEATEYPWDQPGAPAYGEDPVDYVVQPSARLIALSGDMYVAGKGKPARRATARLARTVWDWSCAGGDPNTRFRRCPLAGSDVQIASEEFAVPSRHSGVVMFAAKARAQAGPDDPGGAMKLWLVIDGKQRGSVGVQQLTAPATLGQRTISASYLAAGKHRLRPGKHEVEVHARVEGSFEGISLSRDVPLVWFD
jgi:hypothetical protein